MNECLVIYGRDEIGKHWGFKIPWLRALWVRVPPPVLNSAGLESFCLMPSTGSYLYNYNICAEIFTEFKMILLNTDR